MNLNPGEVWLADLGLAAKTRPIVIVSRSDPDPPNSIGSIRTHNAFLNSYSSEDEGLYNNC